MLKFKHSDTNVNIDLNELDHIGFVDSTAVLGIILYKKCIYIWDTTLPNTRETKSIQQILVELVFQFLLIGIWVTICYKKYLGSYL